jgi:hypothetical protein
VSDPFAWAGKRLASYGIGCEGHSYDLWSFTLESTEKARQEFDQCVKEALREHHLNCSSSESSDSTPNLEDDSEEPLLLTGIDEPVEKLPILESLIDEELRSEPKTVSGVKSEGYTTILPQGMELVEAEDFTVVQPKRTFFSFFQEALDVTRETLSYMCIPCARPVIDEYSYQGDRFDPELVHQFVQKHKYKKYTKSSDLGVAGNQLAVFLRTADVPITFQSEFRDEVTALRSYTEYMECQKDFLYAYSRQSLYDQSKLLAQSVVFHPFNTSYHMLKYGGPDWRDQPDYVFAVYNDNAELLDNHQSLNNCGAFLSAMFRDVRTVISNLSNYLTGPIVQTTISTLITLLPLPIHIQYVSQAMVLLPNLMWNTGLGNAITTIASFLTQGRLQTGIWQFMINIMETESVKEALKLMGISNLDKVRIYAWLTMKKYQGVKYHTLAKNVVKSCIRTTLKGLEFISLGLISPLNLHIVQQSLKPTSLTPSLQDNSLILQHPQGGWKWNSFLTTTGTKFFLLKHALKYSILSLTGMIGLVISQKIEDVVSRKRTSSSSPAVGSSPTSTYIGRPSLRSDVSAKMDHMTYVSFPVRVTSLMLQSGLTYCLLGSGFPLIGPLWSLLFCIHLVSHLKTSVLGYKPTVNDWVSVLMTYIKLCLTSPGKMLMYMKSHWTSKSDSSEESEYQRRY